MSGFLSAGVLQQRLSRLTLAREVADLVVAAQYTPYAREQEMLFSPEAQPLQMYWLAPTRESHCAAFLALCAPPHGFTEGLTVLDCGCGTGAMALGLATHRQDLHWVLLGHNQSQLRQAPHSMHRCVGDMHALPLQPQTVDVVLLCYVLGYGVPSHVFEQAWRVLRPHGTVVVWDMVCRDEDSHTDTLLVSLGYKVYSQARLEMGARLAGFGQETGKRVEKAVLHPFMESDQTLKELLASVVPFFGCWRKR